MEALVKTERGKGFMEIREVPEPRDIGPKEVLIRIRVAGICGTDLHIRNDEFMYVPPVTIGHEFSGEVEEVGREVTQFKAGDRVVAEAHLGGCGFCKPCQTGHVEMCSQKRAIGYKLDGCFARYVVLPATSLHRIPDNVSFEQAALTEPLAITVKAVVERGIVELEDFVAVLGCGPIGLLAAAVSRAAGAREVLITGTDQDERLRLPAARKMKVDHLVNVQKEDALQRVRELTGGAGADLVVEASGAVPAIAQAVEMVRINGRISGLGITGRRQVAVPYDIPLKKSVTLSWSFSSSATAWDRALSLLGSGKIDVSPLVTASFPLREWEKAFRMLENQEAIKILLVP